MRFTLFVIMHGFFVLQERGRKVIDALLRGKDDEAIKLLEGNVDFSIENVILLKFLSWYKRI